MIHVLNRAKLLIAGSVLVFLLAGCTAFDNAAADIAAAPEQPVQESVVEQLQAPQPAVVEQTTENGDTILVTELDQVLADLYDRASPATVNIQVGVQVSTADLPEGFEDFFQQPDNGLQFGQGSGFVIDEQGYIVTNHHVAGDAVEIYVTFADGNTVEAELIGSDPDSDLAVIKVDPDETGPLATLPLGDSDSVRPGYTVVAIGNPFGLEGTMTTGIISAIGRTLPSQATAVGGGTFSIPGIIQVDAAINPGNSGGPLMNLNGEVIGVNTAIATQSGTFSGVGYAVPVAAVKRIVPELITNGNYNHPWLGISTNTLTPPIREAAGLEAGQTGLLVTGVIDGGPAAEAGLLGGAEVISVNGFQVPVGGDIITSVDGEEVREFEDLIEYLEFQTSPGDTITLGVYREGVDTTIDVTLQPRPNGN